MINNIYIISSNKNYRGDNYENINIFAKIARGYVYTAVKSNRLTFTYRYW